MKVNYKIQLVNIVILFLFVNALDNSTLSNYKDVKLINLTGIFVPNFGKKIVDGDLNYTFHANVNGSTIILDSLNLNIISVTNEAGGAIEYKYGKKDENLGLPLNITYQYKQNQNFLINIKYSTTTEGESAQFLTKEQTIGGKYPYFFTQSEMIVGRQLLPSQDTPAVKFPFYLGITVSKELRGMISGIFQKEVEQNGLKTYYYKQEIPVPNYLIALAAGNIQERNISDNISVFSEPEFLDQVAKELEDLPTILNYSISYMGPYEWGKYNVLVLPKSFPFSGMENPCLSFCSPCLINGDKSLVDIVFHELIHSWSGNLVTNENWRDFWLNEGITMFLQRKIVGMWKDEDYAKMDGILGTFYIESSLKDLGEDSNYTSLRPNLTDANPDDSYSDIPYEKGYNFMYYIESLIGKDKMQKFFKSYFEHFKYKSIDFYDFQNYFLEFSKNNTLTNLTSKIDWDAWIFKPGRCPIENNLTNKYQKQVDEALEKFKKGELNDTLVNTIKSWNHTSKTVFMNKLEHGDKFLTDEQHDFLTNKLKFYENQDFLVTTNYLRLILSKTDKFYAHEMECLIDYLSNNGASDYMANIYEYFYKRDEVKANETLNNLSTFYHSIMLKQAKKEIEEVKESFPILALNPQDKCKIFNDTNISKIYITSEEYKAELDNLVLSDGITLEKDGKVIGLNCTLNSKEKYCLLKEALNTSGEHTLKIKNRIQKENYAVKVHTSTIKLYSKGVKVNEKTEKKYDFNYAEGKDNNIKIYFNEELVDKVKVSTGDKEIPCVINNSTLECKINDNVLPFDQNKSNEFKKYEIKVNDYCGNEVYSFEVNVKNTETPISENSDSNAFTIILICVGAILVILIIFCIFKRKKGSSNINIDDVEEEKKIMGLIDRED